MASKVQIKEKIEKLNNFNVHKIIYVHKQLKNQKKIPQNYIVVHENITYCLK